MKKLLAVALSVALSACAGMQAPEQPTSQQISAATFPSTVIPENYSAVIRQYAIRETGSDSLKVKDISTEPAKKGWVAVCVGEMGASCLQRMFYFGYLMEAKILHGTEYKSAIFLMRGDQVFKSYFVDDIKYGYIDGGDSDHNLSTFKDETNRFNGNRTVSYQTNYDDTVPFNKTIAVASDGKLPLGGFVSLIKTSPRHQYAKCKHTSWLVDGKPVSPEKVTYSSSVNTNPVSVTERISSFFSFKDMDRLANARLVEYRICTEEGAFTIGEKAGITKVMREFVLKSE